MADINSIQATGNLGRYYDQQNLIVSVFGDAEPVGIGGFYFYALLSDETELVSTSPDVVLEKGTTISDTIFNAPLALSINGYVADLWVSEEVSDPPNKLTVSPKRQADFYGQERDEATTPQINAIEQDTGSVIRDVSNDLSDSEVMRYFGGGSGGSTLPEQFQAFCLSVWQSKQLVQVETLFGIYNSMHIQSFKLNTDSQGRAISFTIRAKQIRIAEINFRQVASTSQQYARNPSSGLNGQTESETNKGTTEGQESSLLSSVGSLLGGSE